MYFHQSKEIVPRRFNLRCKKWKCLILPLYVVFSTVAYGLDIIKLDDSPYGSIGAPATDKSNLTGAGGIIFETRFQPNADAGDVVARAINSEGMINQDETDLDGWVIVDKALWRAHEQLPEHHSRIIFTAGYQFRWSSLPQELKEQITPSIDNAENGIKIINWIRGKSAFEGVNGGGFRVRTARNHMGNEVHDPLGDFIHSSIQYVGPPSNLYADRAYRTFLVENKGRTPVLYVGGNDGMLHAFRASDGKELFGFIPKGVFDNLAYLSAQEYRQSYFVDGTPVIVDAFGAFPKCSSPDNGECWRTILVGGLNRGGKSIYALDVTDPEPFSESIAAEEIFLWEFVHKDLGYTFSRPVIARLHDGRWATIFGNGLNDMDHIGATLFIVDIEDGSLIQKISVPGTHTPNGLSSPTAYDADFDGDVDYIYAGDTDGNLWKFDLTDVDDNGDFEATIAYNDGTKDCPLAKVTGVNSENHSTNRVIQTAPVVTTGENGAVIVIFGTGQLWVEKDTRTDSGDGLFGIFDYADMTAGYGVFPTDFSLTTHDLVTGLQGMVRVIGHSNESSDSIGWKVNFPEGERILSDLVLSNKRINYTSTNPSLKNNVNWLNNFNYLTGGAPSSTFRDIDDGGNNDFGNSRNLVSLNLGNGIVSKPRVVDIDGHFDLNLITRYSQGKVLTKGIAVSASRISPARVSWREILQ